jgi:hypothetical protein
VIRPETGQVMSAVFRSPTAPDIGCHSVIRQLKV